MNAYDTEEQYLREILAMLRESYDKAAKPYIDRIAMIQSHRKPEPIYVTIEQAKAMGIDMQHLIAITRKRQ